MFEAAVTAADPRRVVPPFLPPMPRGRTVVIGAGKASAAMARAVEDHWDGPLEGLVVTRYGHAVPCSRIEIVEAGHPVPDQAGLAAAKRMLRIAEDLGPDDLAICLVSGGGSALLPLPLQGVTLMEKQAVSRALLASGASIRDMNIVRRHLSAIKGGRLAAACAPARVLSLLISDVPGDRLQDIASGPTVADPTTCADALAVLRNHRIEVSPHVLALLESGSAETFKPGDPRLPAGEAHLVAAPRQSLAAAAAVAKENGITPYILGEAIEGDAEEVGKVMAGIALSVAAHAEPFRPPCVLLSGGETTVRLKGTGLGGRNVQFLLSLALAVQGEGGIYALAADTDGVDGGDEIAGAAIDPSTLERAAALGMQAASFIARQDAHSFFQALGDQVITGPTLTNVNDFRAVLVLPRNFHIPGSRW
jgi:hydroxypyruvate reductase